MPGGYMQIKSKHFGWSESRRFIADSERSDLEMQATQFEHCLQPTFPVRRNNDPADAQITCICRNDGLR